MFDFPLCNWFTARKRVPLRILVVFQPRSGGMV